MHKICNNKICKICLFKIINNFLIYIYLIIRYKNILSILKKGYDTKNYIVQDYTIRKKSICTIIILAQF